MKAGQPNAEETLMDSSFGSALERLMIVRLIIFCLVMFSLGGFLGLIVPWLIRHIHIFWK